MRLNIRFDGECEKFCKIFWELNKAHVNTGGRTHCRVGSTNAAPAVGLGRRTPGTMANWPWRQLCWVAYSRCVRSEWASPSGRHFSEPVPVTDDSGEGEGMRVRAVRAAVAVGRGGRAGRARAPRDTARQGSIFLFSARLQMTWPAHVLQWPCTKPRFLAQPKRKQDLPEPAQT